MLFNKVLNWNNFTYELVLYKSNRLVEKPINKQLAVTFAQGHCKLEKEHRQREAAVLYIFLIVLNFRKNSRPSYAHFLSKLVMKKLFFCHNLSLVKLQWQTWVFTSLCARAPSLWKVQAGTTTVLHIFLGALYNPPHPTVGAVVIGYDTGSTGRERGRIWMRKMSSSYFSLLTWCLPTLSLCTLLLPWQHLHDRILYSTVPFLSLRLASGVQMCVCDVQRSKVF